jgi:hypothetical protein
MSSETSHSPNNTPGELRFTPEFYEIRQSLINDINSWLERLADQKGDHTAITSGQRHISDDATIKHRYVGHAITAEGEAVEVKKPGVFLSGSRLNRPIQLQIINTHPNGHNDILEAESSGQITDSFGPGVSSTGNQDDIIAAFGQRDEKPGEVHYYEYVFTANGQTAHNYLDSTGFPRSKPLSTVQDMAMARLAFKHISKGET